MSRNYSSIAGIKTLAADITSGSILQLTLAETTDDLPSPPFMLVIDPDTTQEEIVLVNLDQSGVTEPTYKITRAQDNSGSGGLTHTQGAIVKHMVVASDLQLVHDHISLTDTSNTSSDTAHGVTGGVVGRTNAQTLTNKTLTAPTINAGSVNGVTLTGTTTSTSGTIALGSNSSAITANGTTISATEVGYLDGATSNLQTQINTKSPIASPTFTGTVTIPTGASISGFAKIDGETFTGTVTLPATTSIGTVSSTEIGYIDGVTSSVQTQINTNTPVGSIVMYGGALAPSGWLLCDGGATTGYTALAAVVGPYVPDLRGRGPLGYGTSGDAGITARGTLFQKLGEESHVLTTTEMPSHFHSVDPPNTGTSSDAHSHTWSYTDRAGGVGDSVNGWDSSAEAVDATRTIGTTSDAHSHTVDIAAFNSASAGSGVAHNVMQPSTVVNFIIKF